ncbi:hypothetical protein [Sinorhizobium americanum]|uniref:CHASE3 domain-containing protein n=1 Tax=Sinorhizobium americanum TaxID=194963 RepID=UPI001F376AB2|nr:hypothetical protein [Sinorhizobium americanum]
MAAIVYVTIRSTSHYTQRVQWANNQLEAVTALTVNANRYSEQIAEFLLIGEPERPDYESARAELEAGFDELEKLTRSEAEFLVGSSEQENGGDEIFRITRMRTLYGRNHQGNFGCNQSARPRAPGGGNKGFPPRDRESFRCRIPKHPGGGAARRTGRSRTN